MEPKSRSDQFEDHFDDGINLREILGKYLQHWKWLILSVSTAMTVSYMYIRYSSVPQYEVQTTILIKDDQKGNVVSELSAFEDIGVLNSSSSIENEIEILKSRTLMNRVVRKLKLNVNYHLIGRIRNSEQYNSSPVQLKIIGGDSVIEDRSLSLFLQIRSKDGFDLKNSNGEILGSYAFGEPVSREFGELQITIAENINDHINDECIINVRSIESAVSRYSSSLRIEQVGRSSNVISLKLTDPIHEKAIAILDELVQQYNDDAIADKNQVSQNTSNFIEDRMSILTAELSEVEGNAASFKKDNQLVGVSSQAELFLSTGSENKSQIIETNLQMHLVDFMIDYLQEQNAGFNLIPTNLGFSDPAITTSINSYNQLVLEKDRILESSGERNPIVVKINAQLSSLKNNLYESLNNLKASLEIRQRELNIVASGINAKIAQVPGYERTYREIQRQQQIKETLYLYLLQKREETAIALAVTVANAKIIDSAYGNKIPISPNTKRIYMIALLLGTFLPIGFIYVQDLLDTKIHSKSDLDKIGIPYVGELPKNDSNNGLLIVSKDNRSRMSEAYRSLRTNIDFMMSDVKNKGRMILVTSTISSEGKTHVSLNLAATIALSDKRVLLLGMDLRAPKIMKYLNMDDAIGVTNYIVDKNLTLSDVIQTKPNDLTFDVLSSGVMPPNPAELLMTDRVTELMELLTHNYDYVIVDTAPVGIVTDTLLINKYADLSIYVVRANYLDKRLLHVAESLFNENKLRNMGLVINGSDNDKGNKYGYSYGYGYTYGEDEKKPWWKINFF